MKPDILSNILSKQNGVALVVSLLLLAAFFVIASIAMTMTTLDINMTGNFRSTKKSFYLAEAGVEEAKARMRLGAANPVADNHPDQTAWSAYIGSEAKSQKKGYNSSNSMHVRVPSVQADMGYVVRINHQTDGAGNILYWGDVNNDGVNERVATTGSDMRNIYFVTSEGVFGGSTRVIEAEIVRMPPLHIPAALYVNAPTTVKGASTHIIGTDNCGANVLPGIYSTKPSGSIAINGGPEITGTPGIIYDGAAMNISSVVERYKNMANFTYVVNNDTHTASTTPGPGDGWGTPIQGATQQSPSSCSAQNVVYYNTGDTEIKLSGGVSGCGVLLVDGDLELNGGFYWYGPVITTGTVSFLGGGSKQITGAVLAGGYATNEEDDIGGNTNIIYCSEAVNNQTESMPMQVLSWKDEVSP